MLRDSFSAHDVYVVRTFLIAVGAVVVAIIASVL